MEGLETTMKKTKTILLITLLLLVLVPYASAQRVDSDGDGVLDEFDNCPNTNPEHGLPIITRHPEYIGCSCPQILKKLEDNYCVDVFCFPDRPLEIRERTTSSREAPCPRRRCEGTTLYEYKTGTIRCIQGQEEPYECEEVITPNAEECINNEITTPTPQQPTTQDIYDVITKSYLEESRFIEILNMRNREQIQQNSKDVQKRITTERTTNLLERTSNNVAITTKETIIQVTPNNYYIIKDFVLIERIKGNLVNKNLVISGDYYFDEERQIIVWELNELNKQETFSYKITPSTQIEQETIIQGTVRSKALIQLVLPILLIIAIITGFVVWLINKKEKNNVFKT